MSIAEPIPALFDSPDALRQAFEDGLVRMVEQPVLGAFVLGIQILAGHVEITYYTLLVSGFYALCRLLLLC